MEWQLQQYIGAKIDVQIQVYISFHQAIILICLDGALIGYRSVF